MPELRGMKAFAKATLIQQTTMDISKKGLAFHFQVFCKLFLYIVSDSHWLEGCGIEGKHKNDANEYWATSPTDAPVKAGIKAEHCSNILT